MRRLEQQQLQQQQLQQQQQQLQETANVGQQKPKEQQEAS